MDYSLLLVNATIITVDPEHRVIPNGFLAVARDRIAAIGTMEQLKDGYPNAERVLDLSGHAVLPGLVDGHGHGGHCLIRTLGEEADDWGTMAEHIYYRCTDEEFWRAEGALAAAERIKFGTTTGVSMIGSTPRMDWVGAVAANLEGSVPVGIRQLSGIGCSDGVWPKIGRVYRKDGSYYENKAMPRDAWETTEEALRTLNGIHPRQICIVAPGHMGRRQGESEEDSILNNRKMFELAERYHVPLHTHAYAGDVQFLYDHTPEVMTERMSLTHSTGYTDEEIRILAETGTYIFHGPTTYAHVTGHCRVMDMLEAGVNLAVVTDGTAPDRSYDLWRDMKNVMWLQRFEHRDPTLIGSGKALELVTIEPAKALGLGKEIGSLEVGKKADIIAVDVRQPHLAPFGRMPVERLVYHAMGQDVDLTIVDGSIVMENRKLTLVDEDKILRDAGDALETMLERLGSDPDYLREDKLYSLRKK